MNEEVKRTSIRTWDVSTPESAETVYFQGGKLECTCFAFNRFIKTNPNYKCRHILLVLEEEKYA
jgi:hypothetical protein